MELGDELVSAAWRGDTPRVRQLLAKGADPNAKAKTSATALIWAGMCCNYGLVRLLLDSDADPNIHDDAKRTALFYAVIGPKVLDPDYRTDRNQLNVQTTVEYLLAAGADVHTRDNDGDTPLTLARRRRDKPVIVMSLTGAPAGKKRQLDDIVRLLEEAAKKPDVIIR